MDGLAELSFRKRHRLKSKEVRALGGRLEEAVGVDLLYGEAAVDRARGVDMDYLLIGGRVAYLVMDDVPFPSLHTLLEHQVEGSWVRVDVGAVPYLANGADCMAPGVVDADPSIREGDWVWISDPQHDKPLAVGRALMSGPDMVVASKGKAVKTIHWVGDRIWSYE